VIGRAIFTDSSIRGLHSPCSKRVQNERRRVSYLAASAPGPVFCRRDKKLDPEKSIGPATGAPVKYMAELRHLGAESPGAWLGRVGKKDVVKTRGEREGLPGFQQEVRKIDWRAGSVERREDFLRSAQLRARRSLRICTGSEPPIRDKERN